MPTSSTGPLKGVWTGTYRESVPSFCTGRFVEHMNMICPLWKQQFGHVSRFEQNNYPSNGTCNLLAYRLIAGITNNLPVKGTQPSLLTHERASRRDKAKALAALQAKRTRQRRSQANSARRWTGRGFSTNFRCVPQALSASTYLLSVAVPGPRFLHKRRISSSLVTLGSFKILSALCVSGSSSIVGCKRLLSDC